MQSQIILNGHLCQRPSIFQPDMMIRLTLRQATKFLPAIMNLEECLLEAQKLDEFGNFSSFFAF